MTQSNGKAVIFTKNGAQIIPCKIKRIRSAHNDMNDPKIKFGSQYLLVGFATDDKPELIDAALKYTQTKFFRLMLQLERLAQFAPINTGNVIMFSQTWHYNGNPFKSDIDWSVPVAELDAQLFKKFDFTPEMIQFTEDFNHDAVHHDEN